MHLGSQLVFLSLEHALQTMLQKCSSGCLGKSDQVTSRSHEHEGETDCRIDFVSHSHMKPCHINLASSSTTVPAMWPQTGYHHCALNLLYKMPNFYQRAVDSDHRS